MEEKIIEPIRMDQNIAYNIKSFDSIGDNKTKDIIKALIIYFSFQNQKDLFNYGILDPIKFCKTMQIDRTNIMRKKKNALSLNNADLTFQWETYIEDALYTLFSTSIFEEYKGNVGNKEFVGLRNFNIIKDIRCFNSNIVNRGKKKKYYQYILDEHFERNLNTYFFNIELENFIKLKKVSLDDFYLILKNIYNKYSKQGISEYHFVFEELVNHFNITASVAKAKKSKINAVFRKLETILYKEIPEITFDWKKGNNQRYAYVPYVSWKNLDSDEIKEIRINTINKVFYEKILKYGLICYRKENDKSLDFWNWIRHPKNKDKIIDIYINTYKETYPINDKLPVIMFAKTFYSKIKNAKNKGELKKVFE